MKTAGVALILVSSFSFGLNYIRRLKKQIDILSDLLIFCNNLKTAISYQLVSINDFISRIDSEEYKNLDFLNDISGYNNISLDLTKEENSRISHFFSSLGKYDKKNQINDIEFFMTYLNSRIDERKLNYNQKSKIAMVLSVSIGAVVSLVMI